MKNQKGITLISLVITIVVLIILAGVAISMTLGENGIFTKAQEAKKMQAIASAKEQIGLEILEAQIEAMENNEELEQSEVETIVAKYGELQSDGDTIILNDTEYEVSLRDIYNTMAEVETDGDSTTELAQLKALLSQTTVTEDKILKDYKAYKDGQLITGTMENYAGQTLTATTVTENGNNAEIAIPQSGYYDATTKISIPVSEIMTFDQFIFGYTGLNGWVTSDNEGFTVVTGDKYIKFSTGHKDHFVACKKTQQKTIKFTVSDYNTCWVKVSNDGTTWETILNEVVSKTNVGNYNHNGEYSYTIPVEYNDYTYIKFGSGWNTQYSRWYDVDITIF